MKMEMDAEYKIFRIFLTSDILKLLQIHFFYKIIDKHFHLSIH